MRIFSTIGKFLSLEREEMEGRWRKNGIGEITKAKEKSLKNRNREGRNEKVGKGWKSRKISKKKKRE